MEKNLHLAKFHHRGQVEYVYFENMGMYNPINDT